MGFISHRGFESLTLRHKTKGSRLKRKLVDIKYTKRDNTRLNKAPVAQLDRVLGYEPSGREFESLRARQIEQMNFSPVAQLVERVTVNH